MVKTPALSGQWPSAIAGPPARHPRVQRMLLRLARLRLRNLNFSIVSNNCWGAHIYQGLNLPFSTPFIGLFLSPQCYLRLLSDFRRNLSRSLEFKNVSDESWVNQLREEHPDKWPIGELGNGIEIHFMHYTSATEAAEKWKRRSARLAAQNDRLFVKFCDRDVSSPDQMACFDSLPFKNKVYFTVRGDCPLRCAVQIASPESRVPHGRILSEISPACFDSVSWINGGPGRVGRWNKWLSCV